MIPDVTRVVSVALLSLALAAGRLSAQSSATPASPPQVVPIDDELKLVVSHDAVLQHMYRLVLRHGMALARITRQQDVPGITLFRITFQGGAVPQDFCTFTVRTALEGPPPVQLSVIAVGPLQFDHVTEGPPKR